MYCNVILWRVRLNIVAVEQCCSAVELHVTVKYLKITSVAQLMLLSQIYVASNNKPYVGLHVKCPMLH
jgi:hypothetical protein